MIAVVNPDWIHTNLFTKLRQQHMLNAKQVIFNTYLLMTKMGGDHKRSGYVQYVPVIFEYHHSVVYELTGLV